MKEERKGTISTVGVVKMKVGDTKGKTNCQSAPQVVGPGQELCENEGTIDRFVGLELEVTRKQVALDEARKVYERTNIEARNIGLLRHAEDLLKIARKNLRVAREKVDKETAQLEAEQKWRALRAPSDLQQLVLDYGTYDKITTEAWARFDADMAEWKQKMREGYFDHAADRPT